MLRVREEVRLDLERRSEAGAGRRVAHLVARRERTGRGDTRLLPRLDILAHHEELLTARVGATSEGRVLWLGTRGRPPSLPSARSGTRAARPGNSQAGERAFFALEISCSSSSSVRPLASAKDGKAMEGDAVARTAAGGAEASESAPGARAGALSAAAGDSKQNRARRKERIRRPWRLEEERGSMQV